MDVYPLLTSPRRSLRWTLAQLVSCRNSQTEFLARARDISSQGIALEGHYCPEPGTILELNLNLGPSVYCEALSLRCEAVVLRRTVTTSGNLQWACKFTLPIDRIEEKIGRYLMPERLSA